MNKGLLMPAMAVVLAAIILFAAAWGLNGIAAANAQAEHISIMRTILPGSESFILEPYTGDDGNIRSVHKSENGFVVETVTYGYAGEITMLVGVSNDGKVMGLVVRDMSETFGLGANALNDHAFLAQFLNSGGSFEVNISGADAFAGATGDETAASEASAGVDALTGATVTSKAIVRGVNSAVAYVTGADASSEATSWGG